MVCRVCLNKSEFEISIYDAQSLEQNIAMVIQKHFWFTPLPNDEISTTICLECWKAIRDFNEFYETIERAHKLFFEQPVLASESAKCLTEEKIENFEQLLDFENIQVANTINENFELGDTAIQKNVDLDIGCNDNKNVLAGVDDLKTGLNVAKKRKVRSKQPANLQKAKSRKIAQIKHGEQLLDLENIEVSDTKSENHDLEDSAIQTNVDLNIDCNENKSSIADVDELKTGLNVLTNRKIRSKQPAKLEKTNNKKIEQKKHCWSNAESEEIVRKHLNLNCDICSFPTLNFNELKNHFEEAHPGTKAFIKCCKRNFNNKQRVVQHAYMHEDPNSFQCEICKKTFASTYSLQSHKKAYHPSENELIFKCDQCERRFPRQYLLDYHKAVHVPIEERKHLCTHCQKTFASNHLLKAHVSMNHTRATNVCHVCAKSIRDKQSFEKHVRLHFEGSGPRVKCPRDGCDKYFKDDDNLKIHLRRHKQENQIFACDQCEKTFRSRIALTSHKGYTHSADLFVCNLCPKTFKRKISLKEHTASHLGEPLYKCPFCTRTFNSNANMHSHKKKQHPLEWENWRKTKTKSAQSAINSL